VPQNKQQEWATCLSQTALNVHIPHSLLHQPITWTQRPWEHYVTDALQTERNVLIIWGTQLTDMNNKFQIKWTFFKERFRTNQKLLQSSSYKRKNLHTDIHSWIVFNSCSLYLLASDTQNSSSSLWLVLLGTGCHKENNSDRDACQLTSSRVVSDTGSGCTFAATCKAMARSKSLLFPTSAWTFIPRPQVCKKVRVWDLLSNRGPCSQQLGPPRISTICIQTKHFTAHGATRF
jgi:hypothetical protein